MTADDRNPTIDDIARRAGVSTMTVSRVINGGARVSAATRERVQAVIDAAGYVPDPAARILARAGAGGSACSTPTPATPTWPRSCRAHWPGRGRRACC